MGVQSFVFELNFLQSSFLEWVLIMSSSLISIMRYNSDSRTLTVVYRHGKGTYRYFEVPQEEWAAFQAAESKGTYLNQIFKARNYRYKKL